MYCRYQYRTTHTNRALRVLGKKPVLQIHTIRTATCESFKEKTYIKQGLPKFLFQRRHILTVFCILLILLVGVH